jgi:2-polyprenyl-3-methyl-5-hydroxy-6-metoxy-1,4-benzoquinol methylase
MAARAVSADVSAIQGPVHQFSLLDLSPHESVQAFCELLRDELNHRSAHGLDVQGLRHYYRKLFLTDGTLSPLGVYGYASRLAPVLLSLRKAGPDVKLLDAGCGYGTEAILFALSGADVTGAELVPERIALARSRLSFYQSRTSGSFSVQFVNADVLRYLERAGPFDVIWTIEAASHIHPLENFLTLAYKSLSPGGLLITSDPNALNPLALYQACRIRGSFRRTLRVKAMDPDSGAPMYEAVERIFSVLGYTRKLRSAGFEVRQIIMSGFLGASFVPLSFHKSKFIFSLLTSFQRILQSLPILRLLGTVYTTVAQKVA